MTHSIEFNIAKVRELIRVAEKKYQRTPGSVTLVGVSKTYPADCIRQAVAAGVTHIGENYLQEAQEKQARLRDLPITWHFIGPIQSNKTRAIAEAFDWVHSVDRLKIARRLSEQRPPQLPPLNLCLQVNISGEASKSGFAAADVATAAAQIMALPRIRLRGLMAIPRATGDPNLQRESFRALAGLLAVLQREHPQLDTLSMGMSADMDAAIAEGSTQVRIGTAIFGQRD